MRHEAEDAFDLFRTDAERTGHAVEERRSEAEAEALPFDRHLARVLWSDRRIEDVLPPMPEPGTCYHVCTAGDIDFTSFLAWISRAQRIDRLLMSCWYVSETHAREFARAVRLGRVRRFDAVLGEYAPFQFANACGIVENAVRDSGGVFKVSENHAKILAGWGPAFPFAVRSSGNPNGNIRIEQTVVSTRRDVAEAFVAYGERIRPYRGWLAARAAAAKTDAAFGQISINDRDATTTERQKKTQMKGE